MTFENKTPRLNGRASGMTDTQRRENLRKANAVRFAVADIRHAVTTGKIPVALAVVSPELQNVALVKVLQWTPKVGPVRSRKLMNDPQLMANFGIACGALTARQREVVAGWGL